ncbi:MAG: sulfurtransferase [Proteobacteria bacterium]|nr:sulfurtransferase [Pseudomonadota bacterium]
MSAKSVPVLVGADWLASALGQPGLVVIDFRLAADGGKAGYEAGHIPGAVHSDYAADGWREKRGNAGGLRPEAAHLASLFGRLGITPQSHVVLVPAGTSANDLAASARAFWTLRHAGHTGLSILDGGMRAWIAHGGAVETGLVAPDAAAPYPIAWQPAYRAQAQGVLAAVNAHSHVLIDARSPSFHAGAEKATEAKRAGHIPGAINVNYTGLFDVATGRIIDLPALRARFEMLPDKPVITYCNTGHTAALDWFILSEVLGQPDIALYDGSMTEWTEDESRPVALL